MKNLFEISKIIFENPTLYKEISKLDKVKNFFMLNRRFAINYPIQSQLFNNLNINQNIAIDIWHQFLSSKYNKQPHWLFIKGVKSAKKEKEKKIKVSQEVIKKYSEYYNIEIKSINDALTFYNKEFIQELKKFEKLINL